MVLASVNVDDWIARQYCESSVRKSGRQTFWPIDVHTLSVHCMIEAEFENCLMSEYGKRCG